jgi:hypothetical protein
MLWNVYVIEDGECHQLNSQPFDSEMVALAIDQLDSADAITLVRCKADLDFDSAETEAAHDLRS